MSSQTPLTDCGLPYSHDWHSYRTPRGKVKVCDGDLDKRTDAEGSK